MDSLFEIRVQSSDLVMKSKRAMLKANPDRDQPVTKDRLFNSMVWGDYEFMDGNDVKNKSEMMDGDRDGETIWTEK